MIDLYVKALSDEIKSYRSIAREYAVKTIFIGGGTPSILTGEQIQLILTAVKEIFNLADAETTIECNPGTVTMEKALHYKKCGINRVSLGLQSANNDELKMLGRIHTYEQFLESYQIFRQCGFDNINVDLISALPKQSIADYKQSLQRLIQLNPEHISAYSLIIEEDTKLYDIVSSYREKGIEVLPDEEEDRKMYKLTEFMLHQAGYKRYEISNYARAGKECRHNRAYWTRGNYMGFGLGAASLVKEMRYNNISNLYEYIDNINKKVSIRENMIRLSIVEQMEEFMFLGLRLMEGVSYAEFEKMFHVTLDSVYKQSLDKMMDAGLLIRQGDRVRLTNKGIDISNYVMSEFIQ